MFDYPEPGVSQYKLGVTTTTTSNAATRLITNYNGAICAKPECGTSKPTMLACVLANVLRRISLYSPGRDKLGASYVASVRGALEVRLEDMLTLATVAEQRLQHQGKLACTPWIYGR